MKLKRVILVFLALVMCLPAFACGNFSEPASTDETTVTTAEPSDETTPHEEEKKEPTKIIDAGKAVYKIIYPDYPGETIFSAVRNLVGDIEEVTGVKLETGTDIKPSWQEYDSETYEILIGNTAYPETKEVLDGIRVSDYEIREVGHKIVITAHTEDLIVRAISYFRKNLLKKNTVEEANGTKTLMYEGYSYKKDPEIESAKIAGAELRDYKIVYAKGENGYKNPAEKLSDNITARYGYKLDVVPDSEPETEREILVGPTNRAESASFASAHPAPLMNYAMGVQGKKFVINGRPYCCLQAASKFVAKYLYNDSKSFEISGDAVSESLITVTDKPLTAGADIRVMTANILAEMESWGTTTPVEERVEIVASLLDVYKPDAIGIQEVSMTWHTLLPKYVGDTYELVQPKLPYNSAYGTTNFSTILYDKTRYNLVDSGLQCFSTEKNSYIRLVTWAVLSSKTSDIKFILFNTHWCWDTEEHAHTQAYEESQIIANVLKQYPYPYFCTADYNTKQETTNYNYFLELTGAVDAKYVARDSGTLLNQAGGCGNLGTPRPDSGNSIDHIFMTKGLGVAAFATVVENCTWDISDHSPKYADIILKK